MPRPRSRPTAPPGRGSRCRAPTSRSTRSWARAAGDNLFHSFERFSLRAGESATFSGPDQIENVISRVTGGERSEIDGTIRSTMPGADFYFINPAGVLFGPNASLDVPGSFHVSTADELRFDGGEVFSASDPAASSFSFAAPRGVRLSRRRRRRDPGGGQPARADRHSAQTLSLSGGNLVVENGSEHRRQQPPVRHSGVGR